MDQTTDNHTARSGRIDAIAKRLHHLQDLAETNQFSQYALDKLLESLEKTIDITLSNYD